MEKYLFIWICVLLLPEIGLSQVVNNDIENRLALDIDAPPFFSNTRDCTVQWQCVDQSLTGKCIQYHNDQWFEFNTQGNTQYYINISGQACRDLRGVQLVVIDGIPCEPSTYQVLNCTSLANHEDIFIALDSLKSHHTYLLNVDGYLHDHCEFSIQVSTRPKGLPLQFINDPIEVEGSKKDKYITLQWSVDESLAATMLEYNIFRRHEKDDKSIQTVAVPHEKNAFGSSLLFYSVADTLTGYGRYDYKIVGITTENERLLLGSYTLTHRSQTPMVINNYLTFAIPCEAGKAFMVSVYNGQTKELLNTKEIQCLQNEYLWKYPFSYTVPYYKILVTDHHGQEKEYIYFHE